MTKMTAGQRRHLGAAIKALRSSERAIRRTIDALHQAGLPAWISKIHECGATLEHHRYQLETVAVETHKPIAYEE